MPAPKTYQGGCHCGRVRFETEADLATVLACNCSICAQRGLLLVFTGADKFKLLKGEDELAEYRFHKRVIRHLFCKHCGVESFVRGKKPDGNETVALNVRCLDGVDVAALKLTPYDGKSM